MNNSTLHSLMKLSALQRSKEHYLGASDDEIAFEVPLNHFHTQLDFNTVGKISVPMKAVKQLYELVIEDVALREKVIAYNSNLQVRIESSLPHLEPEDDPRFELYDLFAKKIGY